MKYVVQVGEQRVDVELDARGITVNGRVVQAHLADVPGSPVRLVTIGRGHPVRRASDTNGTQLAESERRSGRVPRAGEQKAARRIASSPPRRTTIGIAELFHVSGN